MACSRVGGVRSLPEVKLLGRLETAGRGSGSMNLELEAKAQSDKIFR